MPNFNRTRFKRACGVLLLLLPSLPLLAAPAPPLKAADDGQMALEPVLAGEFSLQAGKLADAARWYLQAAQAEVGDVGLAERATRIAMLAGDDARASQALALWARRAPASLAMRSTRASLALRQGDTRRARKELLVVLRSHETGAWRHALLALAMPPAQAAALLILPSLVTNVWQMRPWPTLAPMTRRLWPMQAGVVAGTLGGAWLLGAPAGAWAMQALGAALVVYGLWGLSGARVSQVPAGAERVLGPLVGAVTGLVTAHGAVRDSGRALSAGVRSVARRAGAGDRAVVHRFHRGAGGWADAERPVFGGGAERLGADAVAGAGRHAGGPVAAPASFAAALSAVLHGRAGAAGRVDGAAGVVSQIT